MATMRTNGFKGNDTAEDLAGKVAENMTDFTDKARRAMHGASEIAGDVASKAVHGGKVATKFVVKEVREHPLRTLAIGAAVGAVVAAVIMLRNRSHDEE